MFSPLASRGVVLAILLAPAICSVQAGSTVAAVTGETAAAPATAPPPADAVAQATAPSAPPEMSASTRRRSADPYAAVTARRYRGADATVGGLCPDDARQRGKYGCALFPTRW